MALAVLVSGVTIVKPDEVALVLRFGQLAGQTHADQIHGPGLVLVLPYLIDEVVRVPVKRIQETRIDVLTSRGAAGGGLDLTKDGYALTADQNIVQTDAVLKYQVVDPVAWTLRSSAPEVLVRDVVASALTRTIGEMTIDRILGDGKKELVGRARERAQARLDAEGEWVRLIALELTTIRPPLEAASAFDDVQSGFVERQTRVGQAHAYREEALPKATAEAQTAIREAEADAAGQLATARGAAATFLANEAGYRRNPMVVRQRLYREAMEEVFSKVGARVLVPPATDGGRLLIPGDGGPSPNVGRAQPR